MNLEFRVLKQRDLVMKKRKENIKQLIKVIYIQKNLKKGSL